MRKTRGKKKASVRTKPAEKTETLDDDVGSVKQGRINEQLIPSDEDEFPNVPIEMVFFDRPFQRNTKEDGANCLPCPRIQPSRMLYHVKENVLEVLFRDGEYLVPGSNIRTMKTRP